MDFCVASSVVTEEVYGTNLVVSVRRENWFNLLWRCNRVNRKTQYASCSGAVVDTIHRTRWGVQGANRYVLEEEAYGHHNRLEVSTVSLLWLRCRAEISF